MIEIFPDIEQLNNFAAEKFVEIAHEAIKKRGKFTVALAGGSTPKSLYKLLAGEKFKDKIDWESVFFFFGDERRVLPDDEESNFKMVDRNLLKPLDIPENQVFRWQTELKETEKIAEDYEETIKEFFALSKNIFPRFDLILLGMGADGHTASLFPFTKALKENKKIAVANWVETLHTNRLTMTFPTINNASNVIFLVGGAEKAGALREILQGDFQPDKFPAQKVKLNDGNLLWLTDGSAARLLQ